MAHVGSAGIPLVCHILRVTATHFTCITSAGEGAGSETTRLGLVKGYVATAIGENTHE
jgi:hypothetical protein